MLVGLEPFSSLVDSGLLQNLITPPTVCSWEASILLRRKHAIHWGYTSIFCTKRPGRALDAWLDDDTSPFPGGASGSQSSGCNVPSSCLSSFFNHTRGISRPYLAVLSISLDTSFTKPPQTWTDDLRWRLYSNDGSVFWLHLKCGHLEKICQRLRVRLGAEDAQPHEDTSKEDHPRSNQFERSLPSSPAQISLFSGEIGARSPSSWTNQSLRLGGRAKIDKLDSNCEMRDREVTILCDPSPSHRFYFVPDDTHSPNKNFEENRRPREDRRLYWGMIMGARCPISTEAGKRSSEKDGGSEGRSTPPNNDELELVKRRLCSTMFRGEDHKKSKVDAFKDGMSRPAAFFLGFRIL